MRPTPYQERRTKGGRAPCNTHSLVSHTPHPNNVFRLTPFQLAHTTKNRV